MKKYLVAVVLVFLGFTGFAADTKPPRKSLSFASSFVVVPVMANLPGLFGAVWRTKVSLLNPAAFPYSIQATLFDKTGKVGDVTIDMSAGQTRNYDNFLADIFSYSGAGTVKFDSQNLPGGSDNNQFVVDAQVYTDSVNGRYNTSVPSNIFTASGSDAYSPGISVSSGSRTNIGCFNDSSSANQVLAELYDSSNALIVTLVIDLVAQGWNQTSVPNLVSGGHVKFRPAQAAYCYAVVVDNTSNDGSFIQAAEYLP